MTVLFGVEFDFAMQMVVNDCEVVKVDDPEPML